MNKLAPSILSADFSKLAEEVGLIERAGANLIHIDVMDGHFVPNISYGAIVMKSLLGKTKMPFDVHLMVENPDKYIDEFMTENTEYITVHQEICLHLHRTLQHIRNVGAKVGVALNPATPISTLECILDDVDMVLIMSVNPGFGGQKFIDVALDKVRQLAQIKKDRRLDFVIEVDGGVTLENIEMLKEAGASVFVAGSSIFKALDITGCTNKFMGSIKE